MGLPLFLHDEYGAGATCTCTETATGFDASDLLAMEESKVWKPLDGSDKIIELFTGTFSITLNRMAFLANAILSQMEVDVAVGSNAPSAQTDDMGSWGLNGTIARAADSSVLGPDGPSVPWKFTDSDSGANAYADSSVATAVDSSVNFIEIWVNATAGTARYIAAKIFLTGGTSVNDSVEIDSWTLDSEGVPVIIAGNGTFTQYNTTTGWGLMRVEVSNNGTNNLAIVQFFPAGFSDVTELGISHAFGGVINTEATLNSTLAFSGQLDISTGAAYLATFTNPVLNVQYAWIRLRSVQTELELAHIMLAPDRLLPQFSESDWSNMQTTGSVQVSSSGYFTGSTIQKVLRKFPMKWKPMKRDDMQSLTNWRDTAIRDLQPFYLVEDQDEGNAHFCWVEDNPKFAAPITNKDLEIVTIQAPSVFTRDQE